jgi:pimeloyl-ACP methyl ester carboxylesterase
MFGTFQPEGGDQVPQAGFLPDDFISAVAGRISALSTAAGDQPVHLFVAGHSHGGWMAMKLANTLGEDATLHRLTTIDPISYTGCTAANIVAKVTLSAIIPILPVLGMSPVPVACLEPPPDLRAIWPQIAANTKGSWDQYYQTQTPGLHSGPVATASANQLMTYPGLMNAAEGHANILNDNRVWDAFMSEVKSDVSDTVFGIASDDHGGDF